MQSVSLKLSKRTMESSESLRRVILFSHNSNLSGAPISLAQLARRLPEYGYQPLLLLPNPGPLEEILAKWGISYHVLRGSFDIIGFVRCLWAVKPDLVHVNSLVRTWPVILSRLLGKPVLWHVREFLGKKRMYAQLIHFCATRVVLISKEQFGLFKGLKKAAFVQNAVDIEFFESVAPLKLQPPKFRGGITVTYVGSLEPRKGLMVLVKAAALLKEKARIYYIIVGGAPERYEAYKNEIVEFLDMKGLRDNFHFLGPRPDVPNILAATDILCHPVYIEAFGRVILEAMASKLPVIAARTGEIPEIVEDGYTGLLFPPGDEKALAEAIEFLALRKTMRKNMGEKAYEKVKREFNIELHVGKIVELYEDMLTSGR